MSSRPPLSTLEIASTAARHASFSDAAIELGMTHGAVSRRIAALESWLGILLFERHGRGIRLTPDGQRFIGPIDEAFRQIDMAADRWRKRVSNTVRISVVPSFTKLWLLGHLAELEALEYRIDLSVETRNADLERGDVDIAIRYGRGRWPNVHSAQLGTEQHYPIASPKIAERLGAGPTPEQLLSLPLIHDSDTTGWRNWFRETAGINYKLRSDDRRFEDYTLTLAAAEQGLGLALARSPLVDLHLASGSLQRVHDRATASPLNYYLVTRNGEDRPAVLQLLERMQQHFL